MQNDNQNNQFPPTQPPETYSNQNYDFILNPSTKNKMNFDFSKSKLLVISMGILILIILFVIFKSLFSNSVFSKADFLTVVQDQQNIIHVISSDTTTNQEIGLLTPQNQNSVATINLVISSDQQNTLNYLKNNGTVFPLTTINLGINTSLDNQINNSINANNYNSTLDQILTNLLSTYSKDLKLAYSSEHGPKGKALLKTEYKDAYLLNKSLNS